MRTTLDLEDDILETLKRAAPKRGVSMGKLASDLIRKALEPDVEPPTRLCHGVPVIPKRKGGIPVTPEMIDKIRDEIGV